MTLHQARAKYYEARFNLKLAERDGDRKQEAFYAELCHKYLVEVYKLKEGVKNVYVE